MHSDKENNYLNKVTTRSAEISVLKCPICLEVLKNPVELRNNHLFCVSCIERCERNQLFSQDRTNDKQLSKSRKVKEDIFKRTRDRNLKDNNNLLPLMADRNKRGFPTTSVQNKENTLKNMREIRQGKIDKKNKKKSNGDSNKKKLKLSEKTLAAYNELPNDQFVNEWIVNRYDILYERPQWQKNGKRRRNLSPKRTEQNSISSSSTELHLNNINAIRKAYPNANNFHFNSIEKKLLYSENERRHKQDFSKWQLGKTWYPVNDSCSLQSDSHEEAIIHHPTVHNSIQTLQTKTSYQENLKSEDIKVLVSEENNNTKKEIKTNSKEKEREKEKEKEKEKDKEKEKEKEKTNLKAVEIPSPPPTEEEKIRKECDMFLEIFKELNSHLNTYLGTKHTKPSADKFSLVHNLMQYMQERFNWMGSILNNSNFHEFMTNQMAQTEKTIKLKTSFVQTIPELVKLKLKKISNQEIQTNPTSKPTSNAVVSVNFKNPSFFPYEHVDKSQNTEYDESYKRLENTIREVVDSYFEHIKQKAGTKSSLTSGIKSTLKPYSFCTIPGNENFKREKQFFSLPTKDELANKYKHQLCAQVSIPGKLKLKENARKTKRYRLKRNLSLSTLYGINSESIFTNPEAN